MSYCQSEIIGGSDSCFKMIRDKQYQITDIMFCHSKDSNSIEHLNISESNPFHTKYRHYLIDSSKYDYYKFSNKTLDDFLYTDECSIYNKSYNDKNIEWGRTFTRVFPKDNLVLVSYSLFVGSVHNGIKGILTNVQLYDSFGNKKSVIKRLNVNVNECVVTPDENYLGVSYGVDDGGEGDGIYFLTNGFRVYNLQKNLLIDEVKVEDVNVTGISVSSIGNKILVQYHWPDYGNENSYINCIIVYDFNLANKYYYEYKVISQSSIDEINYDNIVLRVNEKLDTIFYENMFTKMEINVGQ